MVHWVKNLLAMQETQETGVRFLNEEDPLEEGMATHSSILAWRIPWTKEPIVLRVAKSQTQLKRLSVHVCAGKQDKEKNLSLLSEPTGFSMPFRK